MSEDKDTVKEEKGEQADAIKQAQGDSLTADQKHANYLKTIERLHNEP